MNFQKNIFVFIDPPENIPCGGLILHTRAPFEVFRVSKLRQADADIFEAHTKKKYAMCRDHSVVITLETCLNRGAGYTTGTTLEDAAAFYYDQRIATNQGRYKNYKKLNQLN